MSKPKLSCEQCGAVPANLYPETDEQGDVVDFHNYCDECADELGYIELPIESTKMSGWEGWEQTIPDTDGEMYGPEGAEPV